MKLNGNFDSIKEGYLFFTVAQKAAAYAAAHPEKKIIKLGIGDVTLPLPQACIDAMKAACDEQSARSGFRGYGPYEGYDFLRKAISDYYKSRGTVVSASEIFVSDGCKSDIGNVLDLFSADITALVPDPVYPVYVDTNLMDGRRVLFAPSSPENGFLPMPDPAIKADLIYLCSPNNPTGAAYDRAGLKAWVDYANSLGAVILYDAAYEAFISDPSLPRSIYEIDGARECAVEFCSFSKTAGFTGTRCGWCVFPDELSRDGKKLSAMWLRRQSTKYNGAPYIIQRGAEAVFSPEGARQVAENLNYYKENAALIAETLDSLGIWYTGGKNSPYIWLKCPNGLGSWEFFDLLLDRCTVVGTPGEGFGDCGRGFFRLTAFGTREATKEAMSRLQVAFGK